MSCKIVEKWVALFDRPYKGEPHVVAVSVPVIETAKQYRPYGEWQAISDVAKRALGYRRVVPKHEMFDTESAALADLVTEFARKANQAAARHLAAQDDLAVVTRAYHQLFVNQTPS